MSRADSTPVVLQAVDVKMKRRYVMAWIRYGEMMNDCVYLRVNIMIMAWKGAAPRNFVSFICELLAAMIKESKRWWMPNVGGTACYWAPTEPWTSSLNENAFWHFAVSDNNFSLSSQKCNSFPYEFERRIITWWWVDNGRGLFEALCFGLYFVLKRVLVCRFNFFTCDPHIHVYYTPCASETCFDLLK